MHFPEQWMIRVGLKELFVPLGIGFEHAGFFEPIKFLTDGIRGVAELGFKPPEIRTGLAVEEELQKKFDPHFGGNERFYHNYRY